MLGLAIWIVLFLVCMGMQMLGGHPILVMTMPGLTQQMIWFINGIIMVGVIPMVVLNLCTLDGVF